MKIAAAVLLGVALGITARAVWTFVVRRSQHDPALQIGTPQSKATGFDPDLREQTQARRERADRARSHAARVDSGGVRLSSVDERKQA